MGLDMYLYKTNAGTHVPDLKTITWNEQELIFNEVAYWRKANAIHGWMVKNIQNGEDDCGTYEVPYDKLVELRDLCKSILDASPNLEEVTVHAIYYVEDFEVRFSPESLAIISSDLPPTRGFFFGDSEAGGNYLLDIRQTMQMLSDIFVTHNGVYGDRYFYMSSW